MTAAQVLTQSTQNHFEAQKVKEKKNGVLSCKDKTYALAPAPQLPIITQVLIKGLQAYSVALAKSKTYAVSHSLEGQIPLSKELLSGLKTHLRKMDLHQELEQAAQKKQLERYASTIAKEAEQMGDLQAQVKAKSIVKNLKKDVLADVDDI